MLIAKSLDEVTNLTHFGSILIDFIWLIPEIGNCRVGQSCAAGVVNFLERCLPELGIANSYPIIYTIVPHGYTHVFGLLP